MRNGLEKVNVITYRGIDYHIEHDVNRQGIEYITITDTSNGMDVRIQNQKREVRIIKDKRKSFVIDGSYEIEIPDEFVKVLEEYDGVDVQIMG